MNGAKKSPNDGNDEKFHQTLVENRLTLSYVSDMMIVGYTG